MTTFDTIAYLAIIADKRAIIVKYTYNPLYTANNSFYEHYTTVYGKYSVNNLLDYSQFDTLQSAIDFIAMYQSELSLLERIKFFIWQIIR